MAENSRVVLWFVSGSVETFDRACLYIKRNCISDFSVAYAPAPVPTLEPRVVRKLSGLKLPTADFYLTNLPVYISFALKNRDEATFLVDTQNYFNTLTTTQALESALSQLQLLPHYPIPIAAPVYPNKIEKPPAEKDLRARDAIIEAIFEKLPRNISEFSCFDYRIVVPPKNSLYKQTIKRVKKDLNLSKTVAKKKVLKVNYGTDTNNYWKQFLKTVCDYPDCLFLVINDEAHWGMQANGMVDRRINHEDLLRPNVITLFVTATPYNILSSALAEVNNRIIDWATVIEKQNIPSEYQFVDQLEAQNKIIHMPTFDTLTEQVSKTLTWVAQKYNAKEKLNMHEIALIMDYCTSLANALRGLGTSETGHIWNALGCCENVPRMPGPLVLIRLNSTELAQLLHAWISKILVAFQKQNHFAVLIDTSETPLTLSPFFEGSLRKMNEKGYRGDYESLVNLPCLLIVVDKGRMGDTFPSTFQYFDLRARYIQQVSSYASLIQDVGRAFGYGVRPQVLISAECQRVLQAPKEAKKPDAYVKKKPSNDEESDDDEEDDVHEIAEEEEEKYEEFIKKEFIPNENHLESVKDKEKWRQVQSQRLLLCARPQIGKTGVYLGLIKKLQSMMTISPDEQVPGYSEWKTIHNRWNAMDSGSLHQSLNSLEWERYHELYYSFLVNWIPEDTPVMQAANIIISQAPGTKLHIADFGCGRALLATFLEEYHHDIKSYDHIVGEGLQNIVTKCNLADVPAEKNSFDYVVLSLALIGINWEKYIEEAFRTLKAGGKILIWEARRADVTIPEFIDLLKKVGFISILNNPGKFWHFEATKPNSASGSIFEDFKKKMIHATKK